MPAAQFGSSPTSVARSDSGKRKLKHIWDVIDLSDTYDQGVERDCATTSGLSPVVNLVTGLWAKSCSEEKIRCYQANF